jgi:hypothetical protein
LPDKGRASLMVEFDAIVERFIERREIQVETSKSNPEEGNELKNG